MTRAKELSVAQRRILREIMTATNEKSLVNPHKLPDGTISVPKYRPAISTTMLRLEEKGRIRIVEETKSAFIVRVLEVQYGL